MIRIIACRDQIVCAFIIILCHNNHSYGERVMMFPWQHEYMLFGVTLFVLEGPIRKNCSECLGFHAGIMKPVRKDSKLSIKPVYKDHLNLYIKIVHFHSNLYTMTTQYHSNLHNYKDHSREKKHESYEQVVFV